MVFSKITEEMIYEAGYSQEFLMEYYGIPLTSSNFCNPYRKDNNPSCKLTYYNDKLIMIDWSKYFYGDWIKVAGLHYEILTMDDFDTTIERYSEILYKVWKDVVINKVPKIEPKKVYIPTSQYSGKPKFEVTTRDWNDDDSDYWFPLTIEDLINVYPINQVYINNVLQPSLNSSTFNPTYGYRIKREPLSDWVIYKPLDTTGHKWRKNISINHIMGIDKNSEFKVLTKSYKDCLVISKYLNVTTYCYQSELYIPDVLLDDTKFILYDNDETGIKTSNLISNKFNITNITLDNSKDAFGLLKKSEDLLIKELNEKIR
jgi:hypothetical protein